MALRAEASEGPSSLELVAVSKSFGRTEILRDINFVAQKGQFISLLGPSGCGKTTTLNIIAGFLQADAGEIRIDGVRKNAVPPHRRNLAMVFQNYSLFPHMKIFDNIAFGLRMRNEPSEEIRKSVLEVLDLVHLSGLEHRYPRELSGGQQQRVGLARALAVRPRILLLDEPLSNLDAKLRKIMQTELRAIQQYVNTTTIYVTHDQEEAFTLSDRIMVMNRGLIEQNGTPVEIYDRPRSEFVAEFIGVTNFFDGKVLSKDQEGVMLEVKGVSVHVADNPLLVKGAKVRLAVRPDRIALRQKTESGTGQLTGTVTSTSFSGAFMRVVVDLGGESLTAHMRTEIANSFPPGSTLSVEVDPSDWLVLPLPSSDTRMKK